jgi:hypothetical protein
VFLSLLIVLFQISFYAAAHQPKSGLGFHIVEVSRSHTIRHTHTHTHACTRTHTHTHTHPVGLLWMRDQLVAQAATDITRNEYKRQRSMPSAGFEPAIPAIKGLQTYALERTTTRFAKQDISELKIWHTRRISVKSLIGDVSVFPQSTFSIYRSEPLGRIHSLFLKVNLV